MRAVRPSLFSPMKQIIMEGPRKSRIAEVPVPSISGAQILVKVTPTGMCHSKWYP